MWRVALILGLTGDLGTKHILANSVRCGAAMSAWRCFNSFSFLRACFLLVGYGFLALHPPHANAGQRNVHPQQ